MIYPMLLGITRHLWSVEECWVCRTLTRFNCVIPTQDGPRRLPCCSIECYQSLARVDREWRSQQREWAFAAYC